MSDDNVEYAERHQVDRLRRDLHEYAVRLEVLGDEMVKVTKTLDAVSRDLVKRCRDIEEALSWHESDPHPTNIVV